MMIAVFMATTALSAQSGTGWKYDESTKTLTLSGNNVDWDGYSGYCQTENIVFDESFNVETIKDMVFFGWELKKIVVPKCVKSIGSQAFSNCEFLESVELEGCQSIGNSAFESCESLKSVKLPEGLQSIGDMAFRGCESLESIELLEGLQSIGNSAFCGCALSSVTLPSTLTYIGENAFDSSCRVETATSIEDAPSISAVAAQYYDLGGRRVDAESYRGVVVKVENGKAELMRVK